MADRVITLRLPEDVAEQLDAYREMLLAERGLEVSQHEAIAALVPGSLLAIFDDCGHMAPMERPAAVADALAAWLRIAVAKPACTAGAGA